MVKHIKSYLCNINLSLVSIYFSKHLQHPYVSFVFSLISLFSLYWSTLFSTFTLKYILHLTSSICHDSFHSSFMPCDTAFVSTSMNSCLLFSPSSSRSSYSLGWRTQLLPFDQDHLLPRCQPFPYWACTFRPLILFLVFLCHIVVVWSMTGKFPQAGAT